eukprot:scaffold61790_cov65-Phaeocystis_antarctica.AAC.4
MCHEGRVVALREVLGLHAVVGLAHVAIGSAQVRMPLRVADEAVRKPEPVECAVEPERKLVHRRAVARVQPVHQLVEGEQRFALDNVQSRIRRQAVRVRARVRVRVRVGVRVRVRARVRVKVRVTARVRVGVTITVRVLPVLFHGDAAAVAPGGVRAFVVPDERSEDDYVHARVAAAQAVQKTAKRLRDIARVLVVGPNEHADQVRRRGNGAQGCAVARADGEAVEPKVEHVPAIEPADHLGVGSVCTASSRDRIAVRNVGEAWSGGTAHGQWPRAWLREQLQRCEAHLATRRHHQVHSSLNGPSLEWLLVGSGRLIGIGLPVGSDLPVVGIGLLVGREELQREQTVVSVADARRRQLAPHAVDVERGLAVVSADTTALSQLVRHAKGLAALCRARGHMPVKALASRRVANRVDSRAACTAVAVRELCTDAHCVCQNRHGGARRLLHT